MINGKVRKRRRLLSKAARRCTWWSEYHQQIKRRKDSRAKLVLEQLRIRFRDLSR